LFTGESPQGRLNDRRFNRSSFEENRASKFFVPRDIITRKRKYRGKEGQARPSSTIFATLLHANGCDEASLRSMQFLVKAKTLFVVFAGEI